MSTGWAAYARNVLGPTPYRSLYQNWQYHSTTLGYLLRFAPPPARVLSIGSSLGLFDALLVAHGYDVLSVDNDAEVLKAAAQLNHELGFGLRFAQADAFSMPQYHDLFDVAFSAGLVEHWHGRETVRLLQEHARCARLVQVEVPTPWTVQVASVEAVTEDMHPFGPREFAARVRAAGLDPVKIYTLGSAPSRAREVLESVLPPYVFRRVQGWTGLAMGVGVVARR